MSAPRWLFHWTDEAALSAIARAAGPDGRFTIGSRVPGRSVMHAAYPALRGRPALFAWTHPVTGAALNHRRIYAGASPARARLVILRVRSGARVLRLSTPKPCRGRRSLGAELERAELIDNEIIFADGAIVREWIVLRSSAIAEWTADPAPLRAFLRAQARSLSDPSADYPPSAMHARSSPVRRGRGEGVLSIVSILPLRRRVLLPRLWAAASLDARRVPRAARRRLSRPVPSGGLERAEIR